MNVQTRTQVFISYARDDADLSRNVAQALKEEGVDTWLDSAEVFPGDNWFGAISNALTSSGAMVVLFTPNSVESPWIRHEVDFALTSEAYKGRLIPLLVGNVDPKTIPWILRKMQYVQIAEPSDESAIRAAARKIALALQSAA